MKEVKVKRFAGPFKEVPYEFYIQSPIGLVPKEGGDGTRLIFHLSYPKKGTSVNSSTPHEMCTVLYPSFDKAIQICLNELKDSSDSENSPIFIGKSDMRSAFRNLGLNPRFFRYLVMKARNPKDGLWYYFIDKCLPFGASISCALFQEFSDAIAHIVKTKSGKDLVNYLDDYLFAALTRLICNGQIRLFLSICERINFLVSFEKTEWASQRLTFLGLLVDTIRRLVCIPLDKIKKAKQAITEVINSKKVKIHDLQKLCGFLNFLCKAIVPGRTFTRRIYSLTAGKYKDNTKLKQHHHVKVSKEVKADLQLWLKFLDHPTAVCRPFTEFNTSERTHIHTMSFHTDASLNSHLGCGGWFETHWYSMQWDPRFIMTQEPSIAYLELYALTAGIILWSSNFKNKFIYVSCDNQSVVYMSNNMSSSCTNCMVLLRIIVMGALVNNVRIFARNIDTKSNDLADSLSRIQMQRFWSLVRTKKIRMEAQMDEFLGELWPMDKLWILVH